MPFLVHETSSLLVSLHQAGSSTSTVESVESISSRLPGSSGSMCLRMRSSKPAPQSRSPPSKPASGSWACWSAGFIENVARAYDDSAQVSRE